MGKAVKKLSIDRLLSLEGKTALITGAANGIGRAIAERYAEAGADLILLDRDEVTLSKTTDDLEKIYDIKIDQFVVDLANPKAIDNFWAELTTLPDILMNNAGVFIAKDFIDSDDDFVNMEMQINFGAVRQMCREMIIRQREKGGVIINISSVEAKMPFKPEMSIYSVSKAAVSALTRSLAREYGDKFKVNGIVPGGIMTAGFKKIGYAALKRFDLGIIQDHMRFKARLPIGHYGQPDDIARVALYLAAPMSDYLQGAEIVADGGFLSA